MAEDTVALTEPAVAGPQPEPAQKKLTMVVMSGDFDRLFGAFIIADGAAASGMDVVMFFTFWGLRGLKKDVRTGQSLFGRMIGLMYGGDISKATPSKFNFGGVGRWMFKKMMANHNITTLPQLRDMAGDLGVRMYGCQMSMDVMEIRREDLIDATKACVGVAHMLNEAQDSDITFFI